MYVIPRQQRRDLVYVQPRAIQPDRGRVVARVAVSSRPTRRSVAVTRNVTRRKTTTPTAARNRRTVTTTRTRSLRQQPLLTTLWRALAVIPYYLLYPFSKRWSNKIYYLYVLATVFSLPSVSCDIGVGNYSTSPPSVAPHRTISPSSNPDHLVCDGDQCKECVHGWSPECSTMHPGTYRGASVLIGRLYFVSTVATAPDVEYYSQDCRGMDTVMCGTHVGDVVTKRFARLVVDRRYPQPTTFHLRNKRSTAQCPEGKTCKPSTSVHSLSSYVTQDGLDNFMSWHTDWKATLLMWVMAYFLYTTLGPVGVVAMLVGKYLVPATACDDMTNLGIISMSGKSEARFTLATDRCVNGLIKGRPVVISLHQQASTGDLQLTEVLPLRYHFNQENRQHCPQSKIDCPTCGHDSLCYTGTPDMGWGTGCFFFAKGTVCSRLNLTTSPNDEVDVWRQLSQTYTYKITVDFDGIIHTYDILPGITHTAHPTLGNMEWDCSATHASPTSLFYYVFEDASHSPHNLDVCSYYTPLSTQIYAPYRNMKGGELHELKRAVSWRGCSPERCTYDPTSDFLADWYRFKKSLTCHASDVEIDKKTGLKKPVNISTIGEVVCKLRLPAVTDAPHGAGLCSSFEVVDLSISQVTNEHYVNVKTDPVSTPCNIPIKPPAGCTFRETAIPAGGARIFRYQCYHDTDYDLGKRSVKLMGQGFFTGYLNQGLDVYHSLTAGVKHMGETGILSTIHQIGLTIGSTAHTFLSGVIGLNSPFLLPLVGGVVGYVAGGTIWAIVATFVAFAITPALALTTLPTPSVGPSDSPTSLDPDNSHRIVRFDLSPSCVQRDCHHPIYYHSCLATCHELSPPGTQSIQQLELEQHSITSDDPDPSAQSPLVFPPIVARRRRDTDGECADRPDTNCHLVADDCFSIDNYQFASTVCRATCGYCTPVNEQTMAHNQFGVDYCQWCKGADRCANCPTIPLSHRRVLTNSTTESTAFLHVHAHRDRAYEGSATVFNSPFLDHQCAVGYENTKDCMLWRFNDTGGVALKFRTVPWSWDLEGSRQRCTDMSPPVDDGMANGYYTTSCNASSWCCMWSVTNEAYYSVHMSFVPPHRMWEFTNSPVPGGQYARVMAAFYITNRQYEHFYVADFIPANHITGIDDVLPGFSDHLESSDNRTVCQSSELYELYPDIFDNVTLPVVDCEDGPRTNSDAVHTFNVQHPTFRDPDCAVAQQVPYSVYLNLKKTLPDRYCNFILSIIADDVNIANGTLTMAPDSVHRQTRSARYERDTTSTCWTCRNDRITQDTFLAMVFDRCTEWSHQTLTDNQHSRYLDVTGVPTRVHINKYLDVDRNTFIDFLNAGPPCTQEQSHLCNGICAVILCSRCTVGNSGRSINIEATTYWFDMRCLPAQIVMRPMLPERLAQSGCETNCYLPERTSTRISLDGQIINYPQALVFAGVAVAFVKLKYVWAYAGNIDICASDLQCYNTLGYGLFWGCTGHCHSAQNCAYWSNRQCPEHTIPSSNGCSSPCGCAHGYDGCDGQGCFDNGRCEPGHDPYTVACVCTSEEFEQPTCTRTKPPPCVHGNRENDFAACVCDYNWSGELCDTALCGPDVCNGGECSVVDGQIRCACPIGSGGPRCDQASCTGIACNGFACAIIQGRPKCQCPPTRPGADCSGVACVPPCELGSCVPDGQGSRCDCPPGYEGNVCQTRNCDTTDCGRGSCQMQNGQPTCLCPSHLTGPGCNQPLCTPACVNGQCQDNGATSTCSCHQPYSGPACTTEICQSNTCNSGICSDTPQGFSCKCPVGTGGPRCDGADCTGVPCNGFPCSVTTGQALCQCPAHRPGADCGMLVCSPACERGTCTESGSTSHCECPAGYEGPTCARRTCELTNCGHGTCSVNSNNQPECTCPPHYPPPYCDTIQCNPGCVHGECVDTGSTAVCQCQSPFSGPACDIELCQADTCNTGVCSDSSSGFKCKCPVGTGGPRCDGADCTGVPCNGYPCSTTSGQALCQCPSHRPGADCGTVVCTPACERGACVEQGSTSVCQCPPGYEGPTCSRRTCELTDCGHGTCHVNTTNQPECTCPPHYPPPYCDTLQCNPPCVTGQCQDTGSTAVCSCPPTHTGPSCSEKICPDNYCVKGHCDSTSGSPLCQCPEDRQGSLCELPKCPQCANGQCIILNGNTKCECDPGYSGDDCASPVCSACHHGVCQVKDSKPHCACENGYSGDACDQPDCPGCQGRCVAPLKCECSPGFVGAECQTPECPGCQGTCIVLYGHPHCQCSDHQYGLHCDTTACDSACNNGECHDGSCICHPGYHGHDCSLGPCNQCVHGHCNGTICSCDDGYIGERCDKTGGAHTCLYTRPMCYAFCDTCPAQPDLATDHQLTECHLSWPLSYFCSHEPSNNNDCPWSFPLSLYCNTHNSIHS